MNKKIAMSFDIMINNCCEYCNCSHCMMDDYLDTEYSVNHDAIERSLNEYDISKIYDIHLAGGEPLLDIKDNLEWLNYFIDKYHSINPYIKFKLTTNLSPDQDEGYFNKKRIRIINSLDTISTSFDPVIRFRQKSDYDIWQKHFKTLVDIKGLDKVTVFVCLTDYLVDYFENSMEKFYDFFCNNLGIYPILLQIMKFGKNKDNHIKTEKIYKWIIDSYKRLDNTKDSSGYNRFVKNLYSQLLDRRKLLCSSAYNQCVGINNKGEIVHCLYNQDCNNYNANPIESGMSQEEVDTACRIALCQYVVNIKQ